MDNVDPSIPKNTGCLQGVLGIISVIAGIFVLLIGFDILFADSRGRYAPSWIIVLAGLIFVQIGLLFFSQWAADENAKNEPWYLWTQTILTVGTFASFSAIFLWGGFGPGEHRFSSEISIGPFSFSRSDNNELSRRCLFGSVGVLFSLGTLWYVSYLVMRGLGIIPHPKSQGDDD